MGNIEQIKKEPEIGFRRICYSYLSWTAARAR